jgi:hypothetical protein
LTQTTRSCTAPKAIEANFRPAARTAANTAGGERRQDPALRGLSVPAAAGMRVESFLARPALSNLGICTIGNAASEVHMDHAGLVLNRPYSPRVEPGI